MGALARLFETRSTLANPDGDLERFLLGRLRSSTYSGKYVTPESVLTQTGWSGAAMFLGEVMGSLPCHVIQGKASNIRRDHPVDPIVHYAANPHMSASDFAMVREWSLLNYGMFFAHQERKDGELVALWPLRADAFRLFLSGGRLRLLYEYQGVKRAYLGGEGEVLYERMFCRDGLHGTAPLAVLEESMAAAMAVDEYTGKYFANSAAPLGVLQTEKKLDDAGYTRLRSDWEEAYKGSGNAHQVAILEQGLEWKSISNDPEKSQLIGVRKYLLSDVSRVTHLPAQILGDLDRATFNNIEQLDIGIAKYCMTPRCVRTEQNYWFQVFTPAERRAGLGIKHNMKGLYRGDMKTQTEFYRQMWDMGAYSPNRILGLEDEPEFEGGDIHTMQAARTTLDRIGEEPAAGGAQRKSLPAVERRARASGRRELQKAFEPIIADASQRLVNIDANKVEQDGLKVLREDGPGAFLIWLDGHRGFLATEAARRIDSPFRSFARALRGALETEIGAGADSEAFEAAIDSLIAGFGTRYGIDSSGQLAKVVREAQQEGADVIEAVATRAGEWREKRPAKIGTRESVLFGSALAKSVFVAAGILAFRWDTFGETCPLCSALDGVVVREGQPFLKEGDKLAPEGAEPLSPSRSIPHPPLHGGCDCVLSPA